MDFVPQPEEAKKFGTFKWLKWHIFRYPNVFLVLAPVPFIIYKFFELPITTSKRMRAGEYVPNVVMNRYAICRSDDWAALATPKRYRN